MMESVDILLVSFMFITILTLGIAGVLAELAEVVRHVGHEKRDGLLVGWSVLLLFAYFTLFWHTADIALLEEWTFWLFLFAETGPVLLLFATNIMLGALAVSPEAEPEISVRQGRVFVVVGLLQVWSIAAGYVLGVGFTPGSALDVVVLAICVVLARSKSMKLHTAGLVVVWLAYIASVYLEVRA